MLSLVGMLFLFRFGAIPPHDASVPISFRAESRKMALEVATRWSPALPRSTRAPQAAARLDLPFLFGTGPALGEIRPAYSPSEWVSAVAHQLHVADHPLGRMAIWLSDVPVQLDARSPSHMYVRLTLRAF